MQLLCFDIFQISWYRRWKARCLWCSGKTALRSFRANTLKPFPADVLLREAFEFGRFLVCCLLQFYQCPSLILRLPLVGGGRFAVADNLGFTFASGEFPFFELDLQLQGFPKKTRFSPRGIMQKKRANIKCAWPHVFHKRVRTVFREME